MQFQRFANVSMRPNLGEAGTADTCLPSLVGLPSTSRRPNKRSWLVARSSAHVGGGVGKGKDPTSEMPRHLSRRQTESSGIRAISGCENSEKW